MARTVRALIYVIVLSTISLFMCMYITWTGQLHLQYNDQRYLLQYMRTNASSSVTNVNHSAVMVPASPTGSPLTKWILMLSYQRTGSSFIGGIFKDPEKIFYIYEPVDTLYSAMYGITEGMTVPGDIFINPNGTTRLLPEHELLSVSWILNKIYTCQISTLPLSVLAHSFWRLFGGNMSHGSGYKSCLLSHNVTFTPCQKFIAVQCGRRFGDSPQKQDMCRNILWGNITADNLDSFNPKVNEHRYNITDDELPPQFRSYFKCLLSMGHILSRCAAQYLDEPCKNKSVRAVKTVRAGMEIGEYLLKQHPNTYVTHSYRDPRGVIQSRMRHPWARGLWSRKLLPRVAHAYCSQVMKDERKRIDLENSGYAGRITHVSYEDFVRDPVTEIKDLYHFWGLELSSTVRNRFDVNNETHQQWESRSNKWNSKLSLSERNIISTECASIINRQDSLDKQHT